MSLGKKLISGIVLTLIVCSWASAASLPDTVRGIKVSGGEQHKSLRTNNSGITASFPNTSLTCLCWPYDELSFLQC
jgi:hypothetical protein